MSEAPPSSPIARAGHGLAVGARCHEHPDREARLVPCERCGDFRCDACFDDDLEAVLCSTCVPTRLPWRRAQTLSTLYDTTKLVIFDGPRFFRTGVGTGEEQKAASYAVMVGIASYMPLMLLIMALTSIAASSAGGADALLGGVCGAFVCFVPSIALGQLVRGWFYGMVYHAVARALGGRSSSTSSFDAAFLSLGLVPIQMLGSVLGLIPLLGPLLGLPFLLGISLWGAHLVACHARARHGLDTVPAYVASLAPIFLGVALVAAFYALLFAIALSSRLPP